MDQRKVSCLHFDLNSEPEKSYYSSEIDMSLPADLNSIPESSHPSSPNQQTNSCLSIDLNSVPESSFLFFDLNLLPESLYHSSQYQQMNSCFKPEVNTLQDSFFSKKKRPQDDVNDKDEIVAKRLKADREKLRREKLNDSFQELGNILDVDRHKNNKRIILVDAIHVLKDLTSELSRLKIKHEALSEESHELVQEKSELGSEKASVKSDIQNLELQLQRSVMLPWDPSDPSEFVVQSPSYPVALHAPSAPIRIYSPPSQVIPSHSGSAFSPYLTLITPVMEKPCSSIASTSYNPGLQNFESNPSSNEGDNIDNFSCGPTELELMPGSITKKLTAKEKGKQPLEDNGTIRDAGFLSMPSSSRGCQCSSSNSMHDI